MPKPVFRSLAYFRMRNGIPPAPLAPEVASGAPKAHFIPAWGNAPGSPAVEYRALKARFIIPMPQSHSQVIIHIIFSTKNREPSIDRDLRPRLHGYLATIGRDNGSEIYRVGGVADHMHILATLSRTVSQAELLEEIKKHSSRWVKEIDPKYAGFAWQRGYGAFSVGRDELDERIQYVEGQEDHHRTVTFQEEYRKFLENHGIEYDERYVWD